MAYPTARLKTQKAAYKTQFKKSVFDNGLTLVSERMSQFRSLSMGVWVKTGTRHELKQEAGFCHFLEHMLFKGTRSRSALQIALEVDQVGGEFNAFTAREHTCFHLLLLDRDCSLGLDVLSDVLMNSTFRADELERERKVILQEISMVEESPEELAYDLFFEYFYQGHGLGRPILGSVKNVQKMTRGELIQFFKRYYRPEDLVFSVAGDISHDVVKRKLRELGQFQQRGGLASRRPVGRTMSRAINPAVSQQKPYAETPTAQEGFWWVERPTEQVHLIWGVLGPHYAHKDRFAAFLLNVFLGGGMSSSLFQEIREKNGLAYTVYSNLSPFVDSGVFSIYAATGMQQVPLCLRLIEECVKRIKDQRLSKEELRVIQDNLKGTILLSSDCVESRMSSIAKNDIFLNRYVSVEEVCRQIEEVTPDDVQRVAHLLFQGAARSILALGPKPTRTIVNQLKPKLLRR